MVLEGSDREVVAACRRGDPEAFRQLFEAYKDKLFSIALRFAGDRSAAMDIAQDAFLKLFSRIGDFRGESSFETWVYRLVVNSCLDYRRRSRRLLPLVDVFLGRLPDSHEDCLTRLLRSEVDERVRAAVERLPPDLRIVVVLRYTEALSYGEIGEVLGCPQGTVASRLNRAHKLLERRLSDLSRKGERRV